MENHIPPKQAWTAAKQPAGLEKEPSFHEAITQAKVKDIVDSVKKERTVLQGLGKFGDVIKQANETAKLFQDQAEGKKHQGKEITDSMLAGSCNMMAVEAKKWLDQNAQKAEKNDHGRDLKVKACNELIDTAALSRAKLSMEAKAAKSVDEKRILHAETLQSVHPKLVKSAAEEGGSSQVTLIRKPGETPDSKQVAYAFKSVAGESDQMGMPKGAGAIREVLTSKMCDKLKEQSPALDFGWPPASFANMKDAFSDKPRPGVLIDGIGGAQIHTKDSMANLFESQPMQDEIARVRNVSMEKMKQTGLTNGDPGDDAVKASLQKRVDGWKVDLAKTGAEAPDADRRKALSNQCADFEKVIAGEKLVNLKSDRSEGFMKTAVDEVVTAQKTAEVVHGASELQRSVPAIEMQKVQVVNLMFNQYDIKFDNVFVEQKGGDVKLRPYDGGAAFPDSGALVNFELKIRTDTDGKRAPAPGLNLLQDPVTKKDIPAAGVEMDPTMMKAFREIKTQDLQAVSEQVHGEAAKFTHPNSRLIQDGSKEGVSQVAVSVKGIQEIFKEHMEKGQPLTLKEFTQEYDKKVYPQLLQNAVDKTIEKYNQLQATDKTLPQLDHKTSMELRNLEKHPLHDPEKPNNKKTLEAMHKAVSGHVQEMTKAPPVHQAPAQQHTWKVAR